MCLEDDASPTQYCFSVFLNVFIVLTQVAIIEYSAAYFYYNVGNNLGEAIFSLMPAVGAVAITGTYVSFMLNKNAIFNFFDELLEFVNERM